MSKWQEPQWRLFALLAFFPLDLAMWMVLR